MPENGEQDWDSYRRQVLADLRRIDEGIQHERRNRQLVERTHWEHMARIEAEIAALKVQAGVWGLMGGLIPAVAAVIVSKL